jgi:hypothetical protein
MSEVQVQADVTKWFRTYETVKEADQLGMSTVLMLIQELSRQESAINLSHERETFLAEARRLAVEAQKAGAAYGPLWHYVQLRQAVVWRQRGGPHSAEHRQAHSILTEIQRDAPSFAIRLGVLTELAKLHLEAQQWSDFDATQQTLELEQIRLKAELEQISVEREASADKPPPLWRPFYELLLLDEQDVRVRGYARVKPDHAYERRVSARKVIDAIERRFGHRPPYGVDISLNFSFARILLGSPRPRDRVDGMLELQQGEARAKADGLFRQARIAQLIREEYIGSLKGLKLPSTSQGRCAYCRFHTKWAWRRDPGIYVCTECNRQPLRL